MSEDVDAQTNIKALLKIFKKKEATDALTVLAKIKSETWVDIRNSVGDLKEFATMGGTAKIVQTLKDTIQLQLDQAMSPITNQLNSIVTEVLGPIYKGLQAIASELATFVAQGPTGAFWGSMVGSIWGELGQLIGGIVGAAIEIWATGQASDIVDTVAGGYGSQEYATMYWTLPEWLRNKMPAPTYSDIRSLDDDWDPLDEMGGSW